jgi:hypothetical protein
MTTQKIFIGIDDQVIEATGEVRAKLIAEIEDMKLKEAADVKAINDKTKAKNAIAERLGLTADELAILLA